MKEKTFLVTILAALFVLGNLTFAAETSKSKSATEMPTIESMNKRMTDMQNEMARIQATKDSKKKQALLEEHMKNMQAQMDMMGQMMSGMMDGKGMGMGMGMGMMKGGMGQGKMMGQNQQHMMSQMGQMHGMMGQMMGQMQDHMKACPFAEGANKE